MKGKQLIWLGMGMFSVCSMLYRAPQIMNAMSGTPGESTGGPEASAVPGGAISGLLQAMGQKPMTMDDLRPGGRSDSDDSRPDAPSVDNLRLFSADAEASLEKTRQLLAQAAAESPANAIAAKPDPTKKDKDEAAKKAARAGGVKVVVHKPGE